MASASPGAPSTCPAFAVVTAGTPKMTTTIACPIFGEARREWREGSKGIEARTFFIFAAFLDFAPRLRRSRDDHKLLRSSWSDSAGPRTPGGRRNFVINPMKEDETRLGRAPKCGARTRDGTPCRRLAIRGRRRRRLHGGLSPGAPRGAKNGNFRNGDWTAESIEERKWLRSLVRSFAKTGTTE
jgi:hypothetical protein